MINFLSSGRFFLHALIGISLPFPPCRLLLRSPYRLPCSLYHYSLYQPDHHWHEVYTETETIDEEEKCLKT